MSLIEGCRTFIETWKRQAPGQVLFGGNQMKGLAVILPTGRRPRILLAAATLIAALAPCAVAAQVAWHAILADSDRPDADKARDPDRKPAEMLAFAKVRHGQTIVDFLPGKGYFTRLFSLAAGPHGAVYAVTPQILLDRARAARSRPPFRASPAAAMFMRSSSTTDRSTCPPRPTWYGPRRIITMSISGLAPRARRC